MGGVTSLSRFFLRFHFSIWTIGHVSVDILDNLAMDMSVWKSAIVVSCDNVFDSVIWRLNRKANFLPLKEFTMQQNI